MDQGGAGTTPSEVGFEEEAGGCVRRHARRAGSVTSGSGPMSRPDCDLSREMAACGRGQEQAQRSPHPGPRSEALPSHAATFHCFSDLGDNLGRRSATVANAKCENQLDRR